MLQITEAPNDITMWILHFRQWCQCITSQCREITVMKLNTPKRETFYLNCYETIKPYNLLLGLPIYNTDILKLIISSRCHIQPPFFIRFSRDNQIETGENNQHHWGVSSNEIILKNVLIIQTRLYLPLGTGDSEQRLRHDQQAAHGRLQQEVAVQWEPRHHGPQRVPGLRHAGEVIQVTGDM